MSDEMTDYARRGGRWHKAGSNVIREMTNAGPFACRERGCRRRVLAVAQPLNETRDGQLRDGFALVVAGRVRQTKERDTIVWTIEREGSKEGSSIAYFDGGEVPQIVVCQAGHRNDVETLLKKLAGRARNR
jgi:hypothetical protein